MVKTFIWSIGMISRAFALAATGLLIAAMLVVCQMIMMRYVFNVPTIWQTDFVIYAATDAMFLGAPYVLLVGGHVGVDVVEMAVPGTVRRYMRIAGAFLGLIFCAVMLVAGWIQFHDAWEGGWTSSSIWAPRLWIPLLALPVSFALLCLQYLAKILELLTNSALPVSESHAASFEEQVQ